MDRTCSTHWIKEKCIQNLSEKLKERDHLGDLDVDKRIILKWSQRNRI